MTHTTESKLAEHIAEQLRAVTDYLGQEQFDSDYTRQFRADSRKLLSAYDASLKHGAVAQPSASDGHGAICPTCGHGKFELIEKQAGTRKVTDADVERIRETNARITCRCGNPESRGGMSPICKNCGDVLP